MTVTLTISDETGIVYPAISTSIQVNQRPINVSYPGGDNESMTVDFSTPASSYITNYRWDYGDSTFDTGAGLSNIQHTFSTTGYYTIILTLTLDDASTIQSQIGLFVGPGTRYIPGHTIYGSETWLSDGIYVVQGNITVAQGGNLTIESGVTVKLFNGKAITVYGTLTATDVTFTWADGQNQWSGIRFDGAGASGSRLENCVIEHAYGHSSKGLYITNSSPTITGCTINNSISDQGIRLENSSSEISNNTINGMSSVGIYVLVGSNPTVTGNTITNNGTGIYIDGNSNGTYQGNTLSGNTSYGLYHSGSTVIDVTNNYWGDPSGPLDNSDDRAGGGWYNPGGLGDKVSNYVDYEPWLGSFNKYRVLGSGYNYPEPGLRASLSLDVSASSLETGWLNYYYSKLRINLQSTIITEISIAGDTVTITGEGTVNGVPGYTFEITIIDGNPDSIRIVIYNPDGSVFFDSGLAPLSDGDFDVLIDSTVQYTLTTIENPSGSGSIAPDCSAGCLFESGTMTTITASEDIGAEFDSWSGCDSSSNTICTVTVDADKTVTANYGACSDSVRIAGVTPVYFSTLQEAYTASDAGATIQIQTLSLTEELTINKSIVLQGGYDCNFTTVIGSTTINGDVTISNGIVTIENIILGN